MSVSMLTIDVIDGIEIPEDDQHANGIAALRRLAAGLNHIYQQLRGLEREIEAYVASEHGPDLQIFSYGNSSALCGGPFDLAECYCHWYSVSAVNFVFAVHALDRRASKPKRSKYREVLGPLLNFRNKVGAHLAMIMEDERDNDAERILSLTPIVAWNGHRVTTVPFTLRRSTAASVSLSDALKSWSLTETHEELANRFPMISVQCHDAAAGPSQNSDSAAIDSL